MLLHTECSSISCSDSETGLKLGGWVSLTNQYFQILEQYKVNSICQGSHRLEKYLNIQGYLEKSLKITFTLKSTWKTHRGLEKSLNLPFTGGFNSVFGDLNQYKIVVPLFGAAYAVPNKGLPILY